MIPCVQYTGHKNIGRCAKLILENYAMEQKMFNVKCERKIDTRKTLVIKIHILLYQPSNLPSFVAETVDEIKDERHGARNHAGQGGVDVASATWCSFHCERLAAACLSIGEDTDVVAVESTLRTKPHRGQA